MPQPRVGDALGELMRAAPAPSASAGLEPTVGEALRRGIATDWFDYLWCTPAELEDLVGATSWRLEDVDRADAPFYTAALRLR